jgi:uncharacterized protein
MHRFVIVWLAATMLALGSATSEGGQARITAGGIYSVPVVSYQDRFFLTVVRQQYDYSCGSAAVATLLTYHYDTPTTEAEAFAAMWEAGDRERIREVGFSLLDIKRFLESRGFPADGFRVSIDAVAESGIPAIALIETNGYRHFVVVKGVSGGQVLVGDPALGMRSYGLAEFERLRVDDIAFVIRSEATLARSSFNRAEEWRLRRASAPVGVGVDLHDIDAHGRLARIPAQPFRAR